MQLHLGGDTIVAPTAAQTAAAMLSANPNPLHPAPGQPYPCAPFSGGVCSASSVIYEPEPQGGWTLSDYNLPCDSVPSSGQDCGAVETPHSLDLQMAQGFYSASTGQHYCGPTHSYSPCSALSSIPTWG